MDFHLQFPIVPFTEKINYRQSCLFMGSCFAENIGELMEKYKFDITINPNGIVYNPASIAIALRKYIANYRVTESDLFYANEVWNSWEHHSSFSVSHKGVAKEGMNCEYAEAHDLIQNIDWLFITFGSAYYYKRAKTGQIVANCHKQPQKEFTKQLLSTEEIVSDYTALITELKAINPKLKIVFTVSPVRYIRDGVVENNRSKARLIESVHQLKETNTNLFYFPAYELVMDDLRDYRFFAEDLTHPNKSAIDYVFDKWMETLFDNETKTLFNRIKSIVTDYNHRPFHSETDAHKQFIALYQERAKQLQNEFPFLNLEEFL